MEPKFKPGDVVQLKSGGPAMTIEEKVGGKAEEYFCIWFRGASREHGYFKIDSLKSYVAPTK
jgi:uncharacterized protein YodC (DUF2158 family)